MMFGKVQITYEGIKLDVLPLAKEAIALLPQGESIDAKSLAKFFKKRLACETVKVLKRDNPFDLHHDQVNQLMTRILHWVRSAHRYQQINDRDLLKMRPLAEVVVEDQCCEAAKRIANTPMPPSDLPRLPLTGCMLGRCDCNYASLSTRQLRERGIDI